jgi:hypothetical protein
MLIKKFQFLNYDLLILVLFSKLVENKYIAFKLHTV